VAGYMVIAFGQMDVSTVDRWTNTKAIALKEKHFRS
jgi:hypothetical protein